jgi:hypothetical protein
LHSYEPDAVFTETWKTLMICTNDDDKPTLQEEVERLFRTTLMVFRKMSRKQQEGYILSLCVEHLPDTSILIAIVKLPSGFRMEEYVIHDRSEGVNGMLIGRKDGKSSLQFPESGTISPLSWVIVKGGKVSFSEMVGIEGENSSISTGTFSGSVMDSVITSLGNDCSRNKNNLIQTIPISNDMKATIYREEKMDRN